MEFNIFFIIIAYLVFLISTTIHEASHALAAKWGGDLTAYMGGQVTLDPMPHIRREPLGMVVFPIIFLFLNGWPFGWASAPYNPIWARENHRKAALMAAAGPFSNLLLAILAAVILNIGMKFGYFNFSDVSNGIGMLFRGGADRAFYQGSDSSLSGIINMLCITFDINVLLFVLNLLPLPSLDGGNFVTIFMSKEMAVTVMNNMANPVFSIVSMMIIWNTFGYIFSPIYSVALGLAF